MVLQLYQHCSDLLAIWVWTCCPVNTRYVLRTMSNLWYLQYSCLGIFVAGTVAWQPMAMMEQALLLN